MLKNDFPKNSRIKPINLTDEKVEQIYEYIVSRVSESSENVSDLSMILSTYVGNPDIGKLVTRIKDSSEISTKYKIKLLSSFPNELIKILSTLNTTKNGTTNLTEKESELAFDILELLKVDPQYLKEGLTLVSDDRTLAKFVLLNCFYPKLLVVVADEIIQKCPTNETSQYSKSLTSIIKYLTDHPLFGKKAAKIASTNNDLWARLVEELSSKPNKLVRVARYATNEFQMKCALEEIGYRPRKIFKIAKQISDPQLLACIASKLINPSRYFNKLQKYIEKNDYQPTSNDSFSASDKPSSVTGASNTVDRTSGHVDLTSLNDGGTSEPPLRVTDLTL